MKSKPSSSIAGAAILLTVIGIISKGFGFFREIIFAGYFGLSQEFDLYLIAAVLPLTLNTIILYLGQNYLIPAYNNFYNKDPENSENFLTVNFWIFTFGGCVITGILYLGSEQIIKFYLQSDNQMIVDQTIEIFRLFLLTIPISCAISILTVYHQILFKFKYPAYSTLIYNFCIIVLVLIFRNSIDIIIIPISFIAGSVFQLLYLLAKSKINFLRVHFNLNLMSGVFSSTLLIIILIESIGQLYILSDRYFFQYVPTGGFAALNFAHTLFLLPVSVLSLAITTAIFPRISELISRNMHSLLEETFLKSVRISIAAFIPITFAFIFYGDYFIEILFQRGKFTANDTLITHKALIFYTISLVFYAIYSIANKVLYGLTKVKALLYITIAGVIIKVVFNFLLVHTMGQNGLALSTSISYIFFTITSIYLIIRYSGIQNRIIYIYDLCFHILNGLLSLIIVKLSFADIDSALGEVLLFCFLLLLNLQIVKHFALDIYHHFPYVENIFMRKLNFSGLKNGK